jgi:ATP adenylyltransferase
VRAAIDFERQLQTMPRNKPGVNPFAEPEPGLYIGNVSATHYALLNKYHVIDNHLLVVTRAYVDQEVLLDLADFEALVACMPRDTPALGFYNGGEGSGFSQPHKHLQVVTLPLSPRADIPMSARFAPGAPPLPFHHAIARTATRDPGEMLRCYRHLLDQAGLHAIEKNGVATQSRGYNFLVTPEWMLLVPRSRDAFEGVAINSLAFAGAMFVRHATQLEAVRRLGPWQVLAQTALPQPG